jgi:glutamate/tyrosine decarboxylase-like PLP-dependent enzyme
LHLYRSSCLDQVILVAMHRPALEEAYRQALRYLDGLADRPVARPGSHEDVLARLGGPVPETGEDPAAAVRALAEAVDPALVATSGPRYFGFVMGGTLPAALAADWLTSTWDQNVAMFVASPAAAQVESIVAGWVLDLLGLPASASVGLVTGCQMANFTGLAAAREAVLARAGWDLELAGLGDAPRLRVLVGGEAHATIYTALRMLGIGRRQIQVVAADEQGRMQAGALAAALAEGAGPAIVCAQAGNVNTGAFDPLAEIAGLARAHQAWLHVDGAFGLWAACSREKRALLHGHDLADSWATDGHKWLNVPYDCGIAIVRDPQAHRRAVGATAAAYLVPGDRGQRDGQDWAPESSRRARAFPLYAGLRSLGRGGLAALVEQSCRLACRLAEQLSAVVGLRVLNQVVLNQVLVALDAENPSAFTSRVLARLQQEGTLWAGPTVWQGHPAIRLSISSWRTTTEDIDRSATAIAQAVQRERGGGTR